MQPVNDRELKMSNYHRCFRHTNPANNEPANKRRDVSGINHYEKVPCEGSPAPCEVFIYLFIYLFIYFYLFLEMIHNFCHRRIFSKNFRDHTPTMERTHPLLTLMQNAEEPA